MVKVSILTVTYKRGNHLRAYLESVVRAGRFSDAEVIILLNGSDPESLKLLEEYRLRYPNIRFIQRSMLTRGLARNELIAESRGEILYFLDDDVLLEENAIDVAIGCMDEYKDIDIAGGPNLTPEGSSLFERAQGYALANAFGTLWMSRRYKGRGSNIRATERSLILCNLVIRRSVFEKMKVFFDIAMICAEENLLLQRLVSKGCRAMFVPDLVVFHERRKTYPGFLRQIFTYGRGRVQAIKSLRDLSNAVYFLPLIFTLYVFSLFLFRSQAYLMPLYGYVSACVIGAVYSSLTSRDPAALPLLLLFFPTIHIAYGLGFVYELLFANCFSFSPRPVVEK